MSKNTEKTTKKLTYNKLMLIHRYCFFAAKFGLKENLHLNIFLPEKNHTGTSN